MARKTRAWRRRSVKAQTHKLMAVSRCKAARPVMCGHTERMQKVVKTYRYVSMVAKRLTGASNRECRGSETKADRVGRARRRRG